MVKLTTKELAVVSGGVLAVYIAVIIFTPNVIKYMTDHNMLSVTDVIAGCISLFVSGWISTKVLARLIRERNYVRLSAVWLAGLALYVFMGEIVKNTSGLLEFFTAEERSLGTKITATLIDTLLGIPLWVAITSDLVLALFTLLSILVSLASLVLFVFSQVAWLINDPDKGKYATIVAALTTCGTLFDNYQKSEEVRADHLKLEVQVKQQARRDSIELARRHGRTPSMRDSTTQAMAEDTSQASWQ